MQDLQEVTQEVHYENFRAERLANGAVAPKKTKWVSVFDSSSQHNFIIYTRQFDFIHSVTSYSAVHMYIHVGNVKA